MSETEFDFESDRLIYSEIKEKDVKVIHQLHSILEIDEFNTLGIPQTVNDTERVLMPVFNDQAAKQRASYMWTVKIKENSEFIGVAGMNLSNDKFCLGELYYKVNPLFWNNGYATEIVKCLILLGFNSLNLHKIEAGVAIENIASIRVLEKAGMTREGLRRKILPIRGEWKDSYHYAIVEDDLW